MWDNSSAWTTWPNVSRWYSTRERISHVLFLTASDEEEGARTAAQVWREAGVLDDDTTDDDSVGGANTQAKGPKRCARGVIGNLGSVGKHGT